MESRSGTWKLGSIATRTKKHLTVIRTLSTPGQSSSAGVVTAAVTKNTLQLPPPVDGYSIYPIILATASLLPLTAVAKTTLILPKHTQTARKYHYLC